MKDGKELKSEKKCVDADKRGLFLNLKCVLFSPTHVHYHFSALFTLLVIRTGSSPNTRWKISRCFQALPGAL